VGNRNNRVSDRRRIYVCTGLELIDQNAEATLRQHNIACCTRCVLRENGMAVPFIGSDVKCILIGEAPGKNEIVRREPFVGRAGQLLMKTFLQYGLTRENFMILNATNCRPVVLKDGKVKNGKPSLEQMAACKLHNELYIRQSGVEYVMTLGGYAQWLFTGEVGNISQRVGSVIHSGSKQIFINYHPAATIYDQSKRGLFTAVVRSFCHALGMHCGTDCATSAVKSSLM
jgi:uracil-DNA glycosylase